MANTRRGISLGSTLLVVALLATLGFALAGVSISHLSLLAKTTGQQRAQNLARSVVAEAIARVLADPAYGKGRLPTEILEVKSPEGVARLAFDPDTAHDWGVAPSTNNIEGPDSVEGPAGSVVPAASVHLVGVGSADGVTQVVEAYLNVPPFPYAIASSGPVRTQGGVLVAGIKPGQVLGPDPDPADLLPADLLSNATLQDAVYLGANTTISGNVETAGGVLLSDHSSISILGELRQHSGQRPVPEIDTDHFDPQLRGMAYEAVQGDVPPVVSGAVRSDQSVVANQGLELDGALLFVDGDLSIRGGLKGNGVVVVTGRTTVEGAVDISSAGSVALLSRGQIDLTGQGQHSSRFRGLVYTEQGFRADQVTLEGTLVVAGGQETGVSLKDARMLFDPLAAVVPVPSGDTTVTAPTGQTVMAFKVTPDPGRPPIITPGDASDPDQHDFVIKVAITDTEAELSMATSPNSTVYPIAINSNVTTPSPDLWDDRVLDWIRVNLVKKSDPSLQYIEQVLWPLVLEGVGATETPQPTPDEPTTTAAIEVIDLSEFLSLEERIRLLHWSEY